jgi:hypothetical protein
MRSLGGARCTIPLGFQTAGNGVGALARTDGDPAKVRTSHAGVGTRSIEKRANGFASRMYRSHVRFL